MLSTSEPAASTSAKDSDGVFNEHLESMKRTRSELTGHVTKLQGELESLMVDSSQYETASRKKFELDEAMSRCLEPGLWSRKSRHPTPDRLRSSAVLVT